MLWTLAGVSFAGVDSLTRAAGEADVGCSAVSGGARSSMAILAAMVKDSLLFAGGAMALSTVKDSLLLLEGGMVLSAGVVVRNSWRASETGASELKSF